MMDTEPLDVTFDNCLLLGTIRAARVLMRRYDNMLKIHGITVVQFAVLIEVRRRGGGTIHAIAEHLDMERSTLTRNLDILVRRGLVAKKAAARGNGKACFLTDAGETLLTALIPTVQEKRNELRARLGETEADGFLAHLHVLMEA